MIEVQVLNKKHTVPNADYTLDKFEDLEHLLYVLTPKLSGTWKLILVDFKIKEVKEILSRDVFPDYIDCLILLPNAKLDQILLEFPKFQQKQKSNKDMYKDLVAGLTHLVEEKAMWALYNSMSGNLNKLEEALTKLDRECENQTITMKQVKSTYEMRTVVYASEVLEAFLTHDRHRWFKYRTLVNDLGEEYAYYALYKQVRKALTDKNSYLQNVDVKNSIALKVDAPFICYVYTLFVTNNNWKNLYALMLRIDNRKDLLSEEIT